MDVVVVKDVRAGPEHGGEILAGAGVGLVQKGGLLRARPSSSRARMTSVRPSASVKPATSTALPNACSESRAPVDVVDRAAAIGAEDVEVATFCPKRASASGCTMSLSQASSAGIIGQSMTSALSTADLAVGERRDLERARHAADAGAVDLARRERRDSEGVTSLSGEAGVFGLGAPDRPLGAAEEAAARKRQDRDERQDQWPNATRHPLNLRALL